MTTGQIPVYVKPTTTSTLLTRCVWVSQRDEAIIVRCVLGGASMVRCVWVSLCGEVWSGVCG